MLASSNLVPVILHQASLLRPIPSSTRQLLSHLLLGFPVPVLNQPVEEASRFSLVIPFLLGLLDLLLKVSGRFLIRIREVVKVDLQALDAEDRHHEDR
jgi:hypothetical protein